MHYSHFVPLQCAQSECTPIFARGFAPLSLIRPSPSVHEFSNTSHHWLLTSTTQFYLTLVVVMKRSVTLVNLNVQSLSAILIVKNKYVSAIFNISELSGSQSIDGFLLICLLVIKSAYTVALL